MKRLLSISGFLLIVCFSYSQSVEKNVKKFWWNIQEGCFTGQSITKKNSMFMSTAQKIPVGAIYEIHKDLGGRVQRTSLAFTHATVKQYLQCFPDSVVSASANPSCTFDLKADMAYQLEIAARLTDESNIGKINAEVQNFLKKAIALKLSIDSWGFEIIEQGKVELCLSTNSDNAFVKNLRNGNRYIALAAIYVKGITLEYALDETTINKIKLIYDSNRDAFLKAGVTFNFQSNTNFSTSLKYDQKFYPFYRMGRITKSGEVKMREEVIEEPDFTETNNN
jgi:hypothetical protein